MTIGLLSVNVLQPGSTVPDEMKTKLQDTYQSSVSGRVQAAEQVKERSALQPIVDMVPSNFFNAASNNRNMLQVVFVAIIVGIALIQIKKEKARPVLEFFEGINELVIKLVENIMLIAPYGVFALIADTITSIAGNNINNVLELLGALAFYMFAVIIGLLIQTLFTYSLVLKIFSKMSLKKFHQGLAPAQILAFSTSSSGATLPVTMERCEEELGVSEEVSSFVLPLGATIKYGRHRALSSRCSSVYSANFGYGFKLGCTVNNCFDCCISFYWYSSSPWRWCYYASNNSGSNFCS